MDTKEHKLKVPYIERFNGNLAVASGNFEDAIKHYSKALMALQHLFKIEDDPVITSQDMAIKLIKEVEILTCVNLAHCYIKIKQYHYAIKYASQALEKDPDNKKALYRKGISYTNIGELEKAKECFEKILEIGGDEGEIKSANLGLQEIKIVEQRNKSNEKAML